MLSSLTFRRFSVAAFMLVQACSTDYSDERFMGKQRGENGDDAEASGIALTEPTGTSLLGDLRGIHHDFAFPHAFGQISTVGPTRASIDFPWDDAHYTAAGTISIDANQAAALASYHGKSIPVTAIISGTPTWAAEPGCKGNNPNISCPPTDAHLAKLRNWGAFIALQYGKGKGAAGIIDTYVIGNEVNDKVWFNGCYQGDAGCTQDQWVDKFAKYYAFLAAGIKSVQPKATILINLDRWLNVPIGGYDWDRKFPEMWSMNSFLVKFRARVKTTYPTQNYWSLSTHPYSSLVIGDGFVTGNDFAPTDNRVTFGTLGALSGFLIKNMPEHQDIYLTESSFVTNSNPGMTQAGQADWLCRSYAAVIGTPNVKQYLYYSLSDSPAEPAAFGSGLFFGASNRSRSQGFAAYRAKQSWNTFAKANRIGSSLKCGFEVLTQNGGFAEANYMVGLKRGYNPGIGRHLATTTMFPNGTTPEMTWNLFRGPRQTLVPRAATTALYQCSTGIGSFVTTASNCENQPHLGLLGYAFKTKQPNTTEIRRCYYSNGDHLINPGACPPGWTDERVLGYGYFNHYYGYPHGGAGP